jgi:Tol biopolymer transport system component
MEPCIRSSASLAILLVALGGSSTIAQTTERVSLDSSGAQSNALSTAASVSSDGRFVAFMSGASNLVAGDTNATYDIFVRDRATGTTERVSLDSTGAEGNGISRLVCLSPDGRFAAFTSAASNLVANDNNQDDDIFVRDRVTGTIERVSVDSAGVEGNAISDHCSLSADGRYVAFESNSSNLVAGDTNNAFDVFVHDRALGTTELVSVSLVGPGGDASSSGPAISADGRFVAFRSAASNLVANDTNGYYDVFVRDRVSGTTERVSVATGGAQADSVSYGFSPSISADGRFVAFNSLAANLVANDTNEVTDVFVRDRTAGTTERVSVSTDGAEGADSYQPAISADGRFVAFTSYARNFSPGDLNGRRDVFVHDRATGATERISVSTASVPGDYESLWPSISSDGRLVAFGSYATNLIAGDTNGASDVFVRDRGPIVPATYCTAGTSSHGCVASIGASAYPSVALGSACSISVANVEGHKFGLFIYGIDNTGFAPAPWVSGSASYLCVKPPVQRTPIQSSGGTANACDGAFALDWNAYQSTHPLALGNPWSAGDKVYVQAWFRDPLAVKSTNLSNALELTYVP